VSITQGGTCCLRTRRRVRTLLGAASINSAFLPSSRLYLVTISDGRILGLVYREDAERLVGEQIG
jgi:hypothetical protein